DTSLYTPPPKNFTDTTIRFSRSDLYYRTHDLAYLDVRLIEAKHTPKTDLSAVLEVSHNGHKPALRLIEQHYAGEMRDILAIDGNISHQKACELEDCIWSHMTNASHLRPNR